MTDLNWRLGLLREISHPVGDKWIPSTTDENLPYVGLEHISPESPRIDEYGNSADVISTKNLFNAGDTLFGKLRPYLKKVALADRSGICSTDIIPIRADSKADPLFVYYLLSSPKVIAKAVESSAGNVMPRASWSDLADIEIKIPPLPEQKKIAEILSGIDKVIASLDLQKTKHEQLFASMLSKVFAELQETNRVCRIGDICEVRRGASPRPIQSKKWWGHGRGWTRISDVTKSKKYLYATKDHLSPAGEQKSVPIDPGSIILSICATIGLPIIPKIPVCIHDGFVWFDGLEKELLPEFAYYFFLSVREGLLSGRQTGTQGNLNTSIVSQQLVPVPTQSEQRQIIKILSEMEFHGEKIDRKLQSHRHLKSSISSDLLSGRKRVGI